MIIDKKLINLTTNFLINVSSAYFVTAALTPTAAFGNLQSKFLNFVLNLIVAIMYSTLAVKINNLYE